MKRVCIFGDSHIAALKSGWSRAVEKEFPGVALVFFGAHRERLSDLAVEGGALVPANKSLKRLFALTSGGAEQVAGDFDRYILCGMGTSLAGVLPIVKAYRPQDQTRDERTLLSNACYRACFASTLRSSRMNDILVKLRQISAAPFDLLAPPLPVGRVYFEMLKERGDDVSIARSYAGAFEEMARDFGARFLPQPQETLGGSALNTDPVYYRDAVRLFGGPDDQTHANAEYGAIVLRGALARMDARQHP